MSAPIPTLPGAAADDRTLTTDRLVLRPWSVDDAPQALGVFGAAPVSRWLVPALERVADETAMRELLSRWQAEPDDPPTRRWAVEHDGAVVGGVAVRRLPPDEDDLEIAWQLSPEHWGRGYAVEAARAALGWAFDNAAHEVHAVMRPGNERSAALARRIGMVWVGETSKYYGLDLQVYRVRPSDLA
ncbi:GNAT family N-acetyltransferase [Angustibacter speluncae]